MAGKASTDPNVFILPDLGEGVHEAELISWKVNPGDTVEEHDIVAEMETDKALVEVPSPRAGTIKELFGKPGDILKVGDPAWTYEGAGGGGGAEAAAGAAPAEAAKTAKSADGESTAQANGQATAEEREDAGTVVGNMNGGLGAVTKQAGKALATPAVRRLAKQLGVDIDKVPGTGLAGRVTDRDVRAFAESGGASGQQQASAQQQPQPAGGGQQTQQRPQQQQQQFHPQPQQQPYGQGFQQQQPQPTMPQQMGYGQQQMPQGYAMPQQAMPMPMMMGYMPTPFGFMPVPMPMPMPGQMPGGAPAGLPHAPGYTPGLEGRPVPAPAQQSQVQPGQQSAQVPFIGVRRKIAERLRHSVDTAVHFTVMDDADVTELDAVRRQLAQQSGEKISFLPFVAAAVCRALTGAFGALNATVDDNAGHVTQHAAVHLGIAADTDSGLMVPVVRGANGLGVVDLQKQINTVAGAARDRSATREQLSGSTFTISNVGSHAGKYATPVINYPEVAILAVGRVYDAPIVRDGQAAVGKLMPLSLACDHRVVDGATAALALAEIVRQLHEPQKLA
jgi:pyruvate dehydrogenase E2 component (dihydrolipoamide acetyltransferase)